MSDRRLIIEFRNGSYYGADTQSTLQGVDRKAALRLTREEADEIVRMFWINGPMVVGDEEEPS